MGQHLAAETERVEALAALERELGRLRTAREQRARHDKEQARCERRIAELTSHLTGSSNLLLAYRRGEQLRWVSEAQVR